MKRKLGLLLLIGALCLTGCNSASNEKKEETNSIGTEVQQDKNDTNTSQEEGSAEEQVYVLEFTDAVTTEGETISSDIFANAKLTMINVWATFCGPCINEMPDLGEIAAEYDTSKFQMIGIVSDVVEDDLDMLAEAKEIIEETNALYPHLLLNEELYVNLVGASDSVPTSYFFNEKGELLGYLVGSNTKEVWEGVINGLLEEME